ncbi:LiaI-LiaF-like domain-containing protein [Roseateles sp. BYS96W]|uniref:LiaI-LiaF-like domain-containing protein n=1 Tax=Pelomonas nitida TaxID=3299027 RepID=A0ABW7G860_9BURK
MNHPTASTLSPSQVRARSAVLGLALIAFGTLALLDARNLFDLALMQTFWPLVLMLVGLDRLVWQRSSGWMPGAVLLVIGSTMLARNLGLTDIGLHQIWPLFVILGGLSLLSRRGAAQAERG